MFVLKGSQREAHPFCPFETEPYPKAAPAKNFSQSRATPVVAAVFPDHLAQQALETKIKPFLWTVAVFTFGADEHTAAVQCRRCEGPATLQK